MPSNRAWVQVSAVLAAAVLVAGPIQSRTYSAGQFMIDLGDHHVGWIESVEGGGMKADVVTHQAPAGQPRLKDLGAVGFSPAILTLPPTSDPELVGWISDTWKFLASPRDAAVVEYGPDHREAFVREFRGARITEVGFPGCDVDGKEPAFMRVVLQPKLAEHRLGSGQKAPDGPTSEQKLWLPANFRFAIDGFDGSKVEKVDAFTIKQTVGETQDPRSVEPTHLEVPDLVLTIDGIDAAPWTKWAESFIQGGLNGPTMERNASLTYVDPAGDPLVRLSFGHVGIYSLEWLPPETVKAVTSRIRVRLYAEEVTLDRPGP